jgi:hypothetical protein
MAQKTLLAIAILAMAGAANAQTARDEFNSNTDPALSSSSRRSTSARNTRIVTWIARKFHQQIPPPSDGGMVRIKPLGQPGSPSPLRVVEPHAVKSVMRPGSSITDYSKLQNEYFKVDNHGNPWPAYPADLSSAAKASGQLINGWAEVVHSYLTQ